MRFALIVLFVWYHAVAYATASPKFYDEDGDRIFENLNKRMQHVSAGERIPVIIQFREDTPRAGTYAARISDVLKSGSLRYSYQNFPAVAASLSTSQIREVLKDPMVEHIELDGVIKKAMDGARSSFGVQQVRSQFGFDGNRDVITTYSTTDIVAAIIDTGINANHPDLQNKILFWKDYVNSRSQPYDDEGHGTSVAGVLAGTGRSNRQFSGVAPGAALVVFKTLDSSGNGTISNGIAAVDETISRKSEFNIRILNLSFSTSGSSNGKDALSRICNRAVTNGISVVVAAGNEGPSSRTIGAPGAAASVITVGAGADLNEKGFFLAEFSSRGPTADHRIKPDLWGPGVKIRTTRSGGGYRVVTGTSFATPFVSGVIALMLDANSTLQPASIKSILMSTTERWIKSGKNNEAGFGRLQAYQAITRAGSITANLHPPEVPDLFSSARALTANSVMTVDVDLASIKYPLAITCIALNPGGNVDLELFSPAGLLLAQASTLERQESLAFKPSSAGTYVVTVRAVTSAQFAITISGDLAGSNNEAITVVHNAKR
ncbi:MAG TPA: S8 family serine peptidase [Acidobacteriota bacterium]|nr:S8 family serine peptidase [Acidobacteriota bacterium]